MPFANEHAARQTEPSQYKTMRRGRVAGFPAGLTVIWGITKDGKSEIQSVRADSSKWDADDFAAWLEEHKMTANVEKATGGTEKQSEGPILEAYTDDQGRLRVMLDAVLDANGEPPKAAQLFAAGTTRTTKGPVLFDSEAGDAVMAVLGDHDRGSLLPFDYEHGMLAKHRTAETGKAAAWFAPAVRDGALWATDIEWTPAADAALRAREFRFFSPAVDIDAKSRRVQRLINVALTNLPAMKGIRPLVASETQVEGANPKEQHDMAIQLFKLLGAEDEAAAIVALAERDNTRKLLLAERDALTEKVKATEAESTKLAARITELESEKTKAAHDALITKLSEDGKLAPSLHDWARTISTEALVAFGEKSPAGKSAATEPKQPPVDNVTLSEEDERVITLHGLDRTKFIAARKTERAAR